MESVPTVTPTDITTEEAALAAIAAEDFFGVAMDADSVVEEFHWHDFDTVLFVMSGEPAAEYEDGRILSAGPGTRADLPGGTVHRDVPGPSYRAVFGFSVDPAKMTTPVNKPVDELPDGTR